MPRGKSHFKSPKMGRKKPTIFKRAWKLFTLSIPMEKVAKPLKRNLLFFKKARKLKKLKHYNYAFIEEYQFSPSSTPLFQHYRKKRSSIGLYSMFLLCNCSGSLKSEGVEVYYSDSPRIGDAIQREPEPLDSSSNEGDSVDKRADKFIARFYEEMRIQRQESVLQYKEMLDRGCR
ncbi:cotton fiber protein [Tasmannia lanceolata]|uniref:cotton fiber protein n=1 Tax=Tasmannia lanceolata TaxID=3420 RepID=UPI0040634BAB